MSTDAQTKKLAAIAYGEAAVDDHPEEIAGVAWAFANRARAWNNKTVDALIKKDSKYVFAIGNARYNKLMKASEKEIAADKGMSTAMESARNALANKGNDPSNGAFWWDGLDFKINGEHPKRVKGFHYADPAHNIFDVEETKKKVRIEHWVSKKKNGKVVKTERGRYSHVYESTAAHGKTIFWKYGDDFIKATGTKAYK
jgi:hypothetical protein